MRRLVTLVSAAILAPILIAVAYAGCMPTISDSDLDRAADRCRMVIDGEIPAIVDQVTSAAISACAGTDSELIHVVTTAVLVNIGCTYDDTNGWNCTHACKMVGDAPDAN